MPAAIPRYIAGVLRSPGYRAHLPLIPSLNASEAMQRGLQLSTGGDWLANYPDPSSYVPQLFGCGGSNSNGYYGNRLLDQKMHQAELLELSDPARANARRKSIDRELTDDAAWVPYVNEREADLVSKRLRNYESIPCGASSPTKAGSGNRRQRPSPGASIDHPCASVEDPRGIARMRDGE